MTFIMCSFHFLVISVSVEKQILHNHIFDIFRHFVCLSLIGCSKIKCTKRQNFKIQIKIELVVNPYAIIASQICNQR